MRLLVFHLFLWEINIATLEMEKGLETLQRMRLCHKDLSPENMMILNNNDRRSLVIDFGMCLRIPYSEDGLTYSEHGQQKHLIRQRNPCGKLVSNDYCAGRNELISLHFC